MQRLRIQLWALVALALPTFSPAWAGHFVIGVEDIDYAPIMSTTGGDFRGYAREMLDLFARSRGHSFEYRPLPTRRLTVEHVADRLDAVFPDNPAWEAEAKRGRRLAYSAAAVPFQDAVMVPADRRDQPLRELGIVRGFTPKRFLPLIESGQLHVTEAGDPARLIRMALAGRVDGVHVALPVARYQLTQLGKPAALVPSSALPVAAYEDHYRLSSIRHAELVAEFDRFLREEQPALVALQRRHGLDERLAPGINPARR
jgi:polar amino acid transport system substrate-binding protein